MRDKQGAIGKPVSGFLLDRVPRPSSRTIPATDHLGWYADPVKGGGGGFLDHGVHFTDFFRWFFESEPAAVTATIRQPHLSRPEDRTITALRCIR